MEEAMLNFLDNATQTEKNIVCGIVGLLFGAILAVISAIPDFIRFYKLKRLTKKNKELVDKALKNL